MENKYGRIASTAGVSDKAIIESPVDIAHNATVYGGVSIGKYSYINVSTVVYGNTTIGRYCSIGRSVEIGLANHPNDFLSTHPFQVAKSLFMNEPGYASVKRKAWRFHLPTAIGHDVWVGAKACINSGVTVGTGAIIAAGAVVTKDVEPYTIVGGVPAKVIKMRFSQDRINSLLKTKWWELPLEIIHDLSFDDIDECISRLTTIRESNE